MNVLLSASPIGRWPVYELETGVPFNMSDWYNWVGGVGAASWLVAYILVIRLCFQQKTYGLPFVAICLNFTWEFMDTFLLTDTIFLWKLIDVLWFAMDCVIVFQLFKYGKKEQIVPELKRGFYWIFGATVLAALVGQVSWVTTFHDSLGLILAFVINLVMSALFIFYYFGRRETGRGLSLSVAWLKMVGTALSSVQCYFLLPLVHPVEASQTQFPAYAFFWFLFVGCFVLDCVYIALVAKWHKGGGPQSVVPA